jgi:hypothetical protein
MRPLTEAGCVNICIDKALSPLRFRKLELWRGGALHDRPATQTDVITTPASQRPE